MPLVDGKGLVGTGAAAGTDPVAAPPARLRWSSGWAIEPLAAASSDNGAESSDQAASSSVLVLSAGADRRVAIDGLAAATRATAARWQVADRVEAETAEEALLVDRLVELGAVVPALGPTWSAVLVGDDEVCRELVDLLGPEARGGSPGPRDPPRRPEPGGLVVAVRTGTAWPVVPHGRVHLGLDLALHHTIVLGPLVLPGASACLGCLDARMAYQWPQPVVPPRPAVQQYLPVAATLLRVQIEVLATTGSSPLVNATAAWDLERGTVDRQTLYKLVGCPNCDTAGSSGRVSLSWETSS